MSMKDNLTENLQAIMAIHNMNLQKLADVTGVHRIHLSRIIRGKIEPGFEVLERMAKGLAIDPPARLLEKNGLGLEKALAG
jgi:transcriptional regulator with XRE-family HTH domain